MGNTQSTQRNSTIPAFQICLGALILVAFTVLATRWVLLDPAAGIQTHASAPGLSSNMEADAKPAAPNLEFSGITITGGQTGNSKAAKAAFEAGKNTVMKTLDARVRDGKFLSSAPRRDAPATQRKKDDLSMPEWARIFNPDGTPSDVAGRNGKQGSDGVPDYLEIYQAFEAGFTEDVLSNGVATDMSALLIARDVADEVLYNGAVHSAHDLGNAFYLLAASPVGNLRLYSAVERLAAELPTFIEFEYNQDQISTGAINPWWLIRGKRTDGDLLVRMNFISTRLTSVELATWDHGAYQVFETDTQGLGQGCTDRFAYTYCVGRPPIDYSQQLIEVWDEEYTPLEPTYPTSFVELGVDVGRLLGTNLEYSGLLIRTPEDIVMSSFRGMGSQASVSVPGIHSKGRGKPNIVGGG